MLQLAIGQAFIQHRQVVAEVQEGLHRVTLRQRAATYVVHVTIWNADDTATTNAQSPAHINLFVMGKEPGIESVYSPVIGAADEERGACGPQDIGYVVVLSVVGLDGVEDSTTTEGIAKAVEIATAGTGILKAVLIKDGEQLGLTGSHIGMGIQVLDHRGEPMVGNLDIGVEQQVVLGLDLCQSPVVTLGKAPVLIQHNQLYLGVMLLQERQRIVG